MVAVLLCSPTMIDKLLANQACQFDFCKQSPRDIRAARKTNRRCCGSKAKARQMVKAASRKAPPDYNAIKSLIVELSDADKVILKQLMRCDHLVVQWRDKNGRLRKTTF